MRQIGNLVFVLTLVSFAISCRRSYTVDGSIDLYGFEGEKLYVVVHEHGEFIVVDSCSVKHGHFQMTGSADSTMFSVLAHGYEPLMPLVLENGHINVRISPSSLMAEGTRYNNQLYDFLDRKNDIDNRFEDIIQRSQQDIFNRMNHNYEDSLNNVVEEAENCIYEFIRKHYGDPLGVSVFLMMCNGSSLQEPTPLVRRVIDDAPKKFLSNYKVREYLRNTGML